MARVVVTQKNFSHYRLPLFQALEQQQTHHWLFIADPRRREGGPAVHEPAALSNVHAVRNRTIRGFTWQQGAWRSATAVSPDALVLTGDVHVITTWALLLMARVRRRAVLLWTQGYTRPPAGPGARIKRMLFSLADALCLYDEQGRRWALESGLAEDKVFVVGNSLPVPRPAAAAPRAAGGDLVIVCVARLSGRRRLDLLLDAVHLIGAGSTGRRVRIRLAGTGDAVEALGVQAARLGLDVEFLGELHDPDLLRTLYDQADLTVLPGHAGLTVVQSLAHGVPVVVGDARDGQAPEAHLVKEGVNGAVYSSDDAVSLAAAIQRLQAHVAQGRVTSEACIRSVRAFTPEEHAAALGAAVSTVLARKRSR